MQFFRRLSEKQSGQALLIVVLVMVVALTVTLSLVSRSVVNLKTSVEQSNSQKALAAAEAGVEQVIKNPANIQSCLLDSSGTGCSLDSGQTTYKVKITSLTGSSAFLLNGGNLIPQDQGAYVWLSPYNPTTPFSTFWPTSGSQDLTIYWGESSTEANNPALEVSLVYGATKNSAQIKRFAFDPATRGNGFYGLNSSDPSNYVFSKLTSGTTFKLQNKTLWYKVVLKNVSQGYLLRINPLYDSAYIAVQGANLPNQGSVINSNATAGNTQRAITVYQGYPELPAEFFPYSFILP